MAANGVAPSSAQKEADIKMMLAADVHLGTKNCDYQMERYVFKKRNDGIYVEVLGEEVVRRDEGTKEDKEVL